MYQQVVQLTGSHSPIEFSPLPQDDPHRRNSDISRARLLLGWETRTSWEEGLTQTIRWFRSLD